MLQSKIIEMGILDDACPFIHTGTDLVMLEDDYV